MGIIKRTIFNAEFECNFLNGFGISIIFCVFYTHIAIFYIILQLLTNFDYKRGRNGSKKLKTFLTNLQPCITENRGTLMASLNSQASLHP
jgi:hypothetical protein